MLASKPARLPPAIIRFEFVITKEPILIRQLSHTGAEETVAEDVGQDLMVESELVLELRKRFKFHSLTATFLGEESVQLLVYDGQNSSAQASNRLRFASFPIHPEPTTLEPGVHRFPLNFLIKPEYAPSYTTSYGGIRYRLKATLDYEPSLLMRLKEPIGTSQIRVEKDVWVGKRIMRPETLPVYSTGSAEDDVSPDSSEADEWDMRQKVMDMKVATLAFKTMRQILLVPEVSMQAIPLNATLSVQAGASFTLKSISFGLKETTRNKAHICESTYPNSKSIYAIIKEEKRYLIGPHVHPPIDPKTTSSIKLHLFVPTDAHTIWRDDIQAEYINTTHFIKIECDAVVDGKAQSFKMEIPIGVFGCRSDFKNPKYRGFVM